MQILFCDTQNNVASWEMSISVSSTVEAILIRSIIMLVVNFLGTYRFPSLFDFSNCNTKEKWKYFIPRVRHFLRISTFIPSTRIHEHAEKFMSRVFLRSLRFTGACYGVERLPHGSGTTQRKYGESEIRSLLCASQIEKSLILDRDGSIQL